MKLVSLHPVSFLHKQRCFPLKLLWGACRDLLCAVWCSSIFVLVYTDASICGQKDGFCGLVQFISWHDWHWCDITDHFLFVFIITSAKDICFRWSLFVCLFGFVCLSVRIRMKFSDNGGFRARNRWLNWSWEPSGISFESVLIWQK